MTRAGAIARAVKRPRAPQAAERASAACYLGSSPLGGRGVFAAREVAPGETVLVFHGSLYGPAEIADFTYFLEVGDDLFLGPSGDIDDFVNHSCDPNCGVFIVDGRALLRALRPVAPDEHLTFDYSTAMVQDGTRFPCSCGSGRCRGEVGPFASLPPAVRRRYRGLGAVPRFVLDAANGRRAS